MSVSFEFEEPDHFTAGAIGKPGERVFYLQAREKTVLVTLKCEKEQVRALAEYLSGLITKLGAPKGAIPTEMDLVPFAEPAWIVASMGVGYDEEHGRIVVDAHEAKELMKGSRPNCPVCSGPMDPTGHVCPRSNGHIVH